MIRLWCANHRETVAYLSIFAAAIVAAAIVAVVLITNLFGARDKIVRVVNPPDEKTEPARPAPGGDAVGDTPSGGGQPPPPPTTPGGGGGQTTPDITPPDVDLPDPLPDVTVPDVDVPCVDALGLKVAC